MKIKATIFIIVLVLVAGAFWYSQNSQKAKNIVFKNQNQVTVQMGVLYNSPKQVKVISKDQVSRQGLLDGFTSYVSAIKAFDKDWMVENVVAGYQESVRKQFNYPEIMDQKNQPWDQVKMTGYVFLEKDGQECALVFAKVGDAGVLRPFPFAKTADGWKFTNILANDETFGIINNALKNGEYSYQ